MIRTLTLVKCDDCDENVLGCEEAHASRELNALAASREEGFHREWTERGITDLCPDCYAARFFLDRLRAARTKK